MSKLTEEQLSMATHWSINDLKPPELPIEDSWYPGCNYQALFDHMSKEHGLILTAGEMTDIINIFKKMDGERIK